MLEKPRHLQVVNDQYLARQAAQAAEAEEAGKPVFIDKFPDEFAPKHPVRLRIVPEFTDEVPFNVAVRRGDPAPIGDKVMQVIDHIPTAEELARQ